MGGFGGGLTQLSNATEIAKNGLRVSVLQTKTQKTAPLRQRQLLAMACISNQPFRDPFILLIPGEGEGPKRVDCPAAIVHSVCAGLDAICVT